MSVHHLERIGAIRELPDEERRSAAAREYVAAVERGERVLVVAQTWNEVHAVNDAIRSALWQSGRLGAGATLMAYQPVDRSLAQKRDGRFYELGQAAFFVRSYGRFKKGERCDVVAADQRGVTLLKDGRPSRVSYRYADRMVIGKPVEMELAPGDRLQLKANVRTAEGTRLHNGELVTVAAIDPAGSLVVANERGRTNTLSPNDRLFVRGYAVTSYASQGKTADTVIMVDSGNPAATNAQQWYVSISRGRKRVLVLTSDKDALARNIQRSGNRELATEMVAEKLSRSMRLRDLVRLAAAHRYYESLRESERRDLAHRP